MRQVRTVAALTSTLALALSLGATPAQGVEPQAGSLEILPGQLIGSGYDAHKWYVRNGPDQPWELTYTPGWQGTGFREQVRGTLPNLRSANAIFDDESGRVRQYDPDFTAQGNTDAFIGMLDTYRQHGLLANDINLQGGNPGYSGALNSAFNSDGSLRQAWMDRAAQVIEAHAQRNMVVVLGYFYFRQDDVLADANAVRRAVTNATDWLIENNYRNVIIEIANEYNDDDYHDIISSESGMAELIRLAKSRFDDAPFRLPVSASRWGDASWPDGPVADAADLALLHCNGVNPSTCASRAAQHRQDRDYPIVVNEDDNTKGSYTQQTLTAEKQTLDQLTAAGTSWGLMINEWNQYVTCVPNPNCGTSEFDWTFGPNPGPNGTGATLMRNFAHGVFDYLQTVVFGTSTPPPNGNLALNKPATASSVETENGQQATLGAERAVDGNTSTRWGSQFSDPQWISVDLGATRSINRVVLRWEGAYGRSYQLQVSDDGSAWTNAFSTTSGDGGVDELSLNATARYVRVLGTQRATQWGYSLWELEVYGAEASAANPHLLRVSDNGRFLVRQDGQPFYYLADTAWELFHRQNREDVDTYLEDRAEKGFTVIQAVALAELDGVGTPNAYGHLPLDNRNPASPRVVAGASNDYWDHVDYIVDKAESLGLFMGFLPTWGRWVNNDRIFTASNAYEYGRFLGARYRDKPIIWILGGDRPADTEERKAIWRAMARGIAVGVSGSEDYSQVLMTYHSWAETSSSRWFPNTEPWLDFHAIQSGAKRWNNPCLYQCPAHDYGLTPVKPTVDIEVNYDDSVVNWDPDQCCYTDYDVRKGSYWSVFAGGHGITYGTRNIWQFWTPDRQPVSYPQKYWYDSLDLPGAFHVAIQKRLMLSRPFLTRVPAQGLLRSDAGTEGSRVQATKDGSGAYAFVYLPRAGQSVTVDLGQLSGSTVNAWWFNPRDGKVYTQAGAVTAQPFGQFPATGTKEFTTPSGGPDWVLVLDDAARGFAAPAT